MSAEQNFSFGQENVRPETRRRLWAIISRRMDRILDRFYARAAMSPASTMLENIDLGKLKTFQKRHWEKIFTGTADAGYLLRISNMHRYHRRIGLNNKHYIAAYLYFMAKFQEAILMDAKGPREAYALIRATYCIVSDDIASAIDVYSRAEA